MFRKHEEIKVDIKNIKFVTDEGVTVPQTAIVTHYNREDSQKRVELYGYYSTDDIINQIQKGKDINLDYCYIDKLSLSDYRISHDLDKKEYVKIKSLSARHTLFNSHFRIDFSFAHFESGNISFENAIFAQGEVSFNSCKFGDGNVSFNYTTFNCDVVDMANCVFGKGNVSFKNTIFKKGLKDFQYTNFGEGDVIFINTEFNNGDVSFINCIFGDGELSFKVARFGTGRKDFHYSKFADGDISFERTEFGDGKLDFRKVEFKHCKVNFNRAIIGNGGLTFEGSELKSGKFNFKKAIVGDGGMDFNEAEFDKAEVYFDGTYFGDGSLNFYASKFQKLSLKSCHLDHYVDVRLAYAQMVDLSDTIIRDILDLKPYDFPIDIKIINFEGMRLVGQVYIGWDQNKVKQLIENQSDTSEKSKAEQFRCLKQNFNVTGQYNDEDEAYVMFKRYEAKAVLHESKNKGIVKRILSYPLYLFEWLVFDKIGLYATAPGRVLLSVIFFWIFFGMSYYLFQIFDLGKTTSSVGNPDNISVFTQSFYHSAITFFTIGYGDVFPQGMSRLFSAMEGFMGVFMMSYFTVAFVRKVLR